MWPIYAIQYTLELIITEDVLLAEFIKVTVETT